MTTCGTVMTIINQPGDLAPSAQSMIFLANRNPYQHALKA